MSTMLGLERGTDSWMPAQARAAAKEEQGSREQLALHPLRIQPPATAPNAYLATERSGSASTSGRHPAPKAEMKTQVHASWRLVRRQRHRRDDHRSFSDRSEEHTSELQSPM